MQIIKIEYIQDANKYVATIADQNTSTQRILSREQVDVLRDIEQSVLVSVRDSITQAIDYVQPTQSII